MKLGYTLTIVLLSAIGAHAQDTTTNSYTQTNLVSDIAGMATFTDPHLVNPWGLSRSAASQRHWAWLTHRHDLAGGGFHICNTGRYHLVMG